MKFPKAWWESSEILDLDSLSDEELEQLDDLWDDIRDAELQSFPEMDDDDVREKIDDTFEDILGIDGLETLRDYLSREPVVTDEPII